MKSGSSSSEKSKEAGAAAADAADTAGPRGSPSPDWLSLRNFSNRPVERSTLISSSMKS